MPIHPKQVVTRQSLGQIANGAGAEVDNLLKAVDQETQMPLRMRVTADRVITIDEMIVKTQLADNRGNVGTIFGGTGVGGEDGYIDASSLGTQLDNAQPGQYWIVQAGGAGELFTGSNPIALVAGDYLICNSVVAGTPTDGADFGRGVAGSDRSRTLPPVDGQLPIFVTGTFTIPTAYTADVTNTTGGPLFNIDTELAANWTDLAYVRLGVNMNTDGQLEFSIGEEHLTEALATMPFVPSGLFAVGHVVLRREGANTRLLAHEHIIQYVGGGGGGGTGNANVYDTALRDQLQELQFELVTPMIFDQDKEDLIDDTDVANRGSFSFGPPTYDLPVAGKTMTTLQLLDSAEFLGTGQDLSSVALSVFWNSEAIDTGATYEVSRDAGVNYTAIDMERVGSTGTYVGHLSDFVEVTPTTISTHAVTTDTLAMNATTVQSLAQTFTATANSVLNSIDLVGMVKTGSPTGLLYVSVYSDTAGDPTTLLGISTGTDITTISAGPATLTVSLPNIVIDPTTTYHIVVSTDAGYKGSYSAATHEIKLAKDTASSGLQSNDGTTTWTDTTDGMQYTLEGRALEAKVKITASAIGSLDGLGLFHLPIYTAVSTGQIDEHVETFSTTTNPDTFTLPFTPDPKLLSVYYIQSGQVFRAPSFSIADRDVIFPINTFDGGGDTYDITLKFVHTNGSSFDNSDDNANGIATIETQMSYRVATDLSPLGTRTATTAHDKVLFDTSNAAGTFVLALSPDIGDTVELWDSEGVFGTNNLTVDRNGSNISGAASDFIMDVDDIRLRFVYAGASRGWLIGDMT